MLWGGKQRPVSGVIMKRFIGCLLLPLALAACGESEDEKLAKALKKHTWDCDGAIEMAGQRANMRTRVRYSGSDTDGSASYRGYMTMNAQGNRLVVEFLGEGDWALRDGELVENADEMAVIGLTINGQLAPSDVVAQLEKEMQSGFAQSRARITRLTDSRLEMREEVLDVAIKCKSI